MSDLPDPVPPSPFGAPTPSAEPEVVAPDGIGTDGDALAGAAGEEESTIGSPAKIIRIGAMVKQLLEEVRSTALDEPARDQLRDIYENSIEELRSTLSPDLADELDRLALDFDEDEVPSEAQLRIAKAQLVGWLEGLFHGIQAALMAQQMAARQQLEGMRGQLPERSLGSPGGPGYI